MSDDALCAIENDNTIVSNFSQKDCKIKFQPGSFSFTSKDNSIIIQLHPMFMWRLIHTLKAKRNNESESDFSRLRTFASYYTKDIFRIYVYETHISYRTNKTAIVETIEMETTQYYATLLLAFNYLHADIRRKYNTPEKTDQILDECLQILQFISKATL
jgi:hypothetical protein